MYMPRFLLFKKKTCVHNAFYYPYYDQGKIYFYFYVTDKEKQKEQKINVKCMGSETYLCFQSDRNSVSAQFSWVLVKFAEMCVRMVRSIFNGCHAWTDYEICS